MQYQGGKSRLAKYIVPILEAARDERPFVEPFCGACSITARMSGERHASDLHRGLITMWRAVQSGWEPPEGLSREQWEQLREANDHDNPLTAFAAFGCSYRGKEWGGYDRPRPNRNSRGGVCNSAAQSARGIARKRPGLSGVRFHHASVFDLEPVDALVYCDPPYAKTVGYRVGDFPRDRFWQWCRDAAARGCTVFVSEYRAPDDFSEVWRKVRRTTPAASGSTKRTERLYRIG